MEEQSKREELLSEELLEWVTGARYDSSYKSCPDCLQSTMMYRYHRRLGNDFRGDGQAALEEGSPRIADALFRLSDAHHQAAQTHYAQLVAQLDNHHHSNSPWLPSLD